VKKTKSQPVKQPAIPAAKEKAKAPAAVKSSPKSTSKPPTVMGMTGIRPVPGARQSIGPMHKALRTKKRRLKEHFQ
jgi:hypothetical protein